MAYSRQADDGAAHAIKLAAISPLGNAVGEKGTPHLDTADASRWMLFVDGLGFVFTDASTTPGYEENETVVVWGEIGLASEDGQQASMRLIGRETGKCPVGEDGASGVPGATQDELTGQSQRMGYRSFPVAMDINPTHLGSRYQAVKPPKPQEATVGTTAHGHPAQHMVVAGLRMIRVCLGTRPAV